MSEKVICQKCLQDHAQLMPKWCDRSYLEVKYDRLVEINKVLVEALERINAFGLFHYDDCPSLIDNEETCDCGMYSVEEKLLNALAKAKEMGK